MERNLMKKEYKFGRNASSLKSKKYCSKDVAKNKR